jgi:hypothetical protein
LLDRHGGDVVGLAARPAHRGAQDASRVVKAHSRRL